MKDRYYLDILMLKTEMQFKGYSESTQNTYVKTVEKFLIHNNKEAIDIKKQDVIDYLDGRLTEVSINSVLVELNALEFFFEQVLGLEITESIRKYKRQFNKKILLSQDQIELLINSVRLRDRLIYQIIIETGEEADWVADIKLQNIKYGEKAFLKGVKISSELARNLIRYADRYGLEEELFELSAQGIRAMNRKNTKNLLGEFHTFKELRHAIAYEMLKRGEIERATKYLKCQSPRVLRQYYRGHGYDY